MHLLHPRLSYASQLFLVGVACRPVTRECGNTLLGFMNEFQRGVAHLASAIRCLVVFPLGVDLPSLFTADCRLLTCPQRLCRERDRDWFN